MFLEENVEEQKEQDYLLEVQRREEYRQRCEQLLKEKEQRERGTELYKWKINQVEKQTLRPKENQRPIGHYSRMTPWKVNEMLKCDHKEQLLSWLQRYNFLKRTKPSVTLQQIRNGKMSLSDRHRWTRLSSRQYEKKMLRDAHGDAAYPGTTKTGKIRTAKGYRRLREGILEYQNETGGKIH